MRLPVLLRSAEICSALAWGSHPEHRARLLYTPNYERTYNLLLMGNWGQTRWLPTQSEQFRAGLTDVGHGLRFRNLR